MAQHEKPTDGSGVSNLEGLTFHFRGRYVPASALAELLGMTDKPEMGDGKPPVELKPGDVVRLRSGSPFMTVCTIYKDPQRAECDWMSRDGQLSFAVFPVGALELVGEIRNDPSRRDGHDTAHIRRY
jgi:uncharacterized protein YodC (DUF2158 family)